MPTDKETLLDLMMNIAKNYDLHSYEHLNDLFDVILQYKQFEKDFAYKMNKTVRAISSAQIANRKLNIDERSKFDKLYKRSLLFEAYDNFDAYLLYVEYDRLPNKKFYAPRRKTLKIVADDMQDLHDGIIKLLAISLPPRVGKSTLGIFFLTWLMGKYPDLPSLMTGHSDKLTKGFYKEVLSIIENTEYLWHDVFPTHKIEKVSTEDETIDIDRIRRFPTLTCRSILGTLTGAVDIKCLAYIDDVIEDIEEALNPNRMDAKYSAYVNQVKDRKSDNVPELHIGTRWGVNDVIGRLQELYADDPQYRFRVIPALNEKDESNFDYEFGLGFSTAYYHDMRRTLEEAGELATWYAKYQGAPYVREGLVFPEDSLNYYNGKLPSGEPTKILICDVAWGGGDSLSCPIAYVYGDRAYIHDWLFSKGDKEETKPQVVAKMIHHLPQYNQFESNNGGDMYADEIEKMIKEKGYRLNIASKTTTGGRNANKHAEILAYAPDIRSFYFRDRHYRDSDYNNAMKEMCQYTQNGKAKHDDAPDSLKQLAKYLIEGTNTYEIGERPF